MENTTATGLETVRAELARACRDADRDPADVTLIAVSKTHGADLIEPVIAAGQRVFAQWRTRDPQDPAGFGDGFTDALRFTICP